MWIMWDRAATDVCWQLQMISNVRETDISHVCDTARQKRIPLNHLPHLQSLPCGVLQMCHRYIKSVISFPRASVFFSIHIRHCNLMEHSARVHYNRLQTFTNNHKPRLSPSSVFGSPTIFNTKQKLLWSISHSFSYSFTSINSFTLVIITNWCNNWFLTILIWSTNW